MTSSDIVSHYVVIKVLDKPGGKLLEFHKWEDMRFEIRNKYSWYFKYRAALAQVQNPKAEVQFIWGSEPATRKTAKQILETRLIYKKGQLTKWKNIVCKNEMMLEERRKNWDQLFSIEDYEPYLADVNTVEAQKEKVKLVQSEIDEIITSIGN